MFDVVFPSAKVVLQSSAPSSEEATAALIVAYVLLVLFLAASVWAGVWVRGDAKRRGHNQNFWLGLWLTGPGIGMGLGLITLAAGQPTGAAVAFIGAIVLSAIVVTLVWFNARSDVIVYNAEGRPVHPRAVLSLNPPFVPGEPPPSHARAAMPAYGWRRLDASSWRPAPIFGYPVPAPGLQRRSVRCPNCQNVFEYVAQHAGPTRVRCPRCALTGTI